MFVDLKECVSCEQRLNEMQTLQAKCGEFNRHRSLLDARNADASIINTFSESNAKHHNVGMNQHICKINNESE